MKASMETVSSGKMNISAASKMHKVPRKTLDDRIKGHVKHGHRPGVSTVLKAKEEDLLEQLYLVYMAICSFPLTRTMVKGFSWAIAKCVGKDYQCHIILGPLTLGLPVPNIIFPVPIFIYIGTPSPMYMGTPLYI